MRTLAVTWTIVATLSLASLPARGAEHLVPVIDGAWWSVAGDPDLGYVCFVSGGSDASHVHVALVDSETGKEIIRLTGKNTNAFEKVHVDCAAAQGKQAFIRIVDRATGPWGHINFGGMYTDPLWPHRE